MSCDVGKVLSVPGIQQTLLNNELLLTFLP